MLLFVAIGLFAIWCWWKGQKAIAFFICLFYVNYIPTSNLPIIIGSIMAERFMYLPLIGFCAVLVIAADLVARRVIGALDDSDTIVTVRSDGPDTKNAARRAQSLAVSVCAAYRAWRPGRNVWGSHVLSQLRVAYGRNALGQCQGRIADQFPIISVVRFCAFRAGPCGQLRQDDQDG